MAGRPRDDDGYSLGLVASRAVAANVRKLLNRDGKFQKDLVSSKLPTSHVSDLLSEEGRRRFQRWQIVEIAARLGVTEEALLPKALPRKQLSQLAPSVDGGRPDAVETDKGTYVKSPYAGVIAHAAEEYIESLPSEARRAAMDRILDVIEKDSRAHPRRLGGE